MPAVHDNRRFLRRRSGEPFFYLADTGWCLFHRLTLAEAAFYLETRARQGFTVIQAVALSEKSGLTVPNANGDLELIDRDPTRPNEAYFRHVDAIVDKAASLGLTIGFLPTWGDKWNQKWGLGPEVFTPANAAVYGEWLGRRYGNKPVIWILGGDRPVESAAHVDILRAMAEGIRRGDDGRNRMTFHPTGGRSSAEWFHHEPWLDFNMRQNGHHVDYAPRYAGTRADYDRTPPKPVIDGEPVYEGHPCNFAPDEHGHTTALDVRRALYWDLFGGACGHTYGHHSVWQFWRPGQEPINRPPLPWQEALEAPGAGQMVHARRLLESRPFFTRIPDDTVLVPHDAGYGPVPSLVPGAGHRRFVATRDAEGSYLMVYAPVGVRFRVRTDSLKAKQLRAWWFNPRSGKADPAGEHPAGGELAFTPPDPGELIDWVMVLDAAERGFTAPGA